LIGEEDQLPYQRPPLSKAYLLGTLDAARLPLRAESFYEKQQIDVLLGQAVVDIGAQVNRVRLKSGAVIPYDHLILALGARNRLLTLKGAERALYLRTAADADAIREGLSRVDSVAVIGGGFIGLELAAAARKKGKQVSVVEAAPRLMARAVPPLLSDFFRDVHQQEGADILLNAAVEEIESDAVRFADGSRCSAELVLAGIGVIPNVELAQAAGLAVGNGIAVDEFLRTSDPSIFAIGDCAEFPCVFANTGQGSRVRLESVQNAVDQAKCVARCIMGMPEPYRDTPWFWTDQYDVRFQMAGLSGGHDRAVIRGKVDSRKFTAFYFIDGRLRAADSVNRFGDHIAVRKLLAADSRLTPEQAEDESFDLKAATP
jgi:3-phenylpropionate/trans-cinnamate dioxygenase ferredoxin reductase subunit